MAAVPLTLENLARIRGGAVAIAANQALAALLSDCRDRPTLLKDRKVTITISAQPAEASSDFEDANVAIEVNRSFPAKSLAVRMHDNGTHLVFQPMAPDNSKQETLLTDEDEPQ